MDSVLRHEQGRYRPIRSSRPQPDDNWPYNGKPNSGNDREYGVKSPKFERHIFLRRDQLMFSVEAQLSIIAEARRLPDGSEDASLTNATDKYRQLFYEWINKHIGEAKTVMAHAVLEKFRTTAMNSIKDVDEVDITLLVPEWYDDTTFLQLCDAVHSFVVNATLLDFLSLRSQSNDPAVTLKQTQKQDGENEIRKLINFAKPGRISKPLKPF